MSFGAIVATVRCLFPGFERAACATSQRRRTYEILRWHRQTRSRCTLDLFSQSPLPDHRTFKSLNRTTVAV
jgi:hypothetical protein